MAELHLGYQKITPIIRDNNGSQYAVDSSGRLVHETKDFVMPRGATQIIESTMRYAFAYDKSIETVDLGSMTKTAGAWPFQYAFYNCTNLKTADFGAFTDITNTASFQYAFQGCTNLTSVHMNNVRQITGSSAFANTFQGCTKLTELRFPKLNNIGTQTNQFHNMLSGVTGCTVHFPAEMQEAISKLADALAGFGGTNTVILFDL